MELTEPGKALSKIIFGLHDKPERPKALHSAIGKVEDSDIAIIFGDVWTNSESIFENHEEVSDLMQHLFLSGQHKHAMSDEENARLDTLRSKGLVTLYRGAAKHNINGFSWTTKKSTAEFFSRRNALDGQPIIVRALFDHSDLLFCFNGRNEFEVVVNIGSDTAQKAIREAKVFKQPKTTVSSSQILQWKIQAYGNSILGSDDARLKMTVITALSNGNSIDKIVKYYEKNIVDLEAFGFHEKAAEIQHQIDAIIAMSQDEEILAAVKQFKSFSI